MGAGVVGGHKWLEAMDGQVVSLFYFYGLLFHFSN